MAVIAAALTVSALLVPVAHGVPVGVTEALPEDQQALVKATETGERVEVVGERTEYATVYANPDGSSLTLEQSVAPVRVKDRDGNWVKPDPSLEFRSDGTAGPKAAAVDLTFSGGGEDAPLVRVAREGRSIALGWPGQLPKPVLEGASAVYAEVLQGVDLRMTATAEGFRELLVVKTPEAAVSPDLKRIEFSLSYARLKLSETQAGGLSATDANATEVFTVPAARMWDSAGQEPQATVTSAVFTGASEADPNLRNDPDDGPGPGDAQVELPVQIEDGALAVVPDVDMLNETDSSDFPLYIDPTLTWGENERTLLRSDGYEDYAWGNGEDDQGKGVGECGTWNGYYCGPGYVQRLYFEFSPASLKGKHVLDATFRITEPWAFQCDPRQVDLVRTNPISSSTTWTGRPKELDWMVDVNVSAGRGSACDPDQPVAPINFNDNPAETNENLTPTVRDFAAGKFARLALELRAHNESDTSAWKRFRNDASLVVDYVGLPAKPTGIGIKVGDARVCETDSADPAIVDSPKPTMMATPQTVSGGESSAMLRGAMAIEKKATDSTWSDAFPTLERPTTGHVGDNVPVSTTTPIALSENVLYRYRAWTRSYYHNYADWLAGPSNAATMDWCYFKIDTSAPKAPQITIGTPYTACTSTSCLSKGGPGQGAVFTFAPSSGDTNASYVYKEDSQTKWSSLIKGSTVKPTIIPQEPGTYRLWVRATDGLGRPGAIGQVEFLVAEGDGPVGRWHFDEDSGQAVDSSTTNAADQDNATLTTGAERDNRGRRGEIWYADDGTPLDQPKVDKGISMNGTAGYAATTSTVLETRSSYTVAAWVRVSPTATKTVTVLSQATTASPWSVKYSPFYISYSAGGAKTWSMRMLSTTQVGGSFTQEIKAQHPTPVGAWTHVAGVFDSTADTISLYVNGLLQGRTAVGAAWRADGGLQIGRTLYADTYTDHLNGSVDEVAVWQTALTDKLIATEAKSASSRSGFEDLEMVASWNPAAASGRTLADTESGYDGSLTLQGGAALDASEIVLDGGDGAAVTAGPVVDESGSFTATTRVELNKDEIFKKPDGYTAQVLGQRTADGSSWGLWFHLTNRETVFDPETETEVTRPVGYWRFGRLSAGGTFTAVSSATAAALDSPVRLTGVYDALGDTGPAIRLYVGYTQNDADKSYTALAGSGDLAVGKGFSATAWSHFLPARISDIRIWAGAAGSSEQLETVLGD
ncbi:LamG domain-containing protein [Streptomyces sp. NPDC087263]|uniref:LamG domain-containing protein n=1 Tax=Streptomyces sp. NPDC087263 TaxID=3365773 RepID=UPI00382435ED